MHGYQTADTYPPPPPYGAASGAHNMAYSANKPLQSGGGGVPPEGSSRRGSASGAASELQTSHGWRDLPWAVAFWLQVVAILVIGFICYREYSDRFTDTERGAESSSDLGPLKYALPLIGICIGVGAVVALLFLSLMQTHGTILIWMSLVWTLILSGAALIFAVVAGNVIGMIFAALIFALTCWYVYAVRHKIPFAAAMLDVSLRCMKTFPSAWTLPLLGMILMGAISYLWAICCFSIAFAVDQSSGSVHSVRGLIFFLLALSFFWTVLVIKGWVHTSIAGVAATYYFLAPNSLPPHPVAGAVKRASTTSFGSICFGSFLVAFIRTLRFFLRMAYQNARESNNNVAACVLCCVEVLLQCIESVINYINQYAFAICAIYGRPFLESANQAWGLMRSRGFDQIINDSLIQGVLSLCMLIGGLITGIAAGVLAWWAFDTDWRVWAGIGFLIGAIFMLVTSEVVESAVITLFICLADDPVALQTTKPDDYNRIMNPLNTNYPDRARHNSDVV